MKTSPVRILLVEDDAVDARAIAAALRTAPFGFELEVAARLSAALETLSSLDPDLVLLDLELPDASGPESVRRLQEAAPTVPILALMDHADGDTEASVVRAGAQDCLVKGLPSVDSMIRCVSYAIDRKNVERQRLRLIEIEHERSRLREALAAQEQLLGVVGHELRTPLASVRAISEVLLAGACDGAQHQEFLAAMNREVVRMAAIVNDLLDAARLNSGAVQWTWDNVGLQEVCGQAMETIRPLVDAAAVRLACSIEPPGLAMRGDAAALRRLVLNLLSNAQKHTARGSIEVRASACGSEVQIEVCDTGIGIRPEIGERLGTPFALNAGNAGDTHVQGTGLGIAICKGIVGAHGGSMAVVSRRDGGTAVTVRLRRDLARPAVAGDALIRLAIESGVETAGERAA